MHNQSSVAPGLLLAMPQLADPNFHRSVVLMIEHHDGGSLGVVVNRPGNIPLAGLLELHELEWKGPPEQRVGIGGPVMSGSRWMIHEPDPELASAPRQGYMVLTDDIAVSTSTDMLERLACEPPAHFLFLMGYAGWGRGQLAEEIEQGSWLHATATPELVFETAPDRMWEAAMRSIGVDPVAVNRSSGLN